MRQPVETTADKTTWEGLDCGVSTEKCVFPSSEWDVASVWVVRSVVVSQHPGISHFHGAKPRLLVQRTRRRAPRLQRICITSYLSVQRFELFFGGPTHLRLAWQFEKICGWREAEASCVSDGTLSRSSQKSRKLAEKRGKLQVNARCSWSQILTVQKSSKSLGLPSSALHTELRKYIGETSFLIGYVRV